jgi:hypothetical protein
MPVINIITGQNNSFSVEKIDSSDYGENIVRKTVGGIIYVSEEITKQILPDADIYETSYNFKLNTLEVFINGVKMSFGNDYSENLDQKTFSFLTKNIDLYKYVNSNSCIIVNYIEQ